MAFVLNRVDRGVYLDSVALMRVSRRLAALPGVEAAALMIGTPSNKALLRAASLLAAEGEQAGPNDLIVTLRAENEARAREAAAAASGLLAEKPLDAQRLPRARSLAGAAERLQGANLALISVPGTFAALEARRALERGLHAMVFSDNVPIEEEVALKRFAQDRGLLLMGPDCGTALIGGVPLAFANAVPRGDIGLVSASGTGLQEVSTLIARAGGGISHGIGVGGRDLDARVGALATLSAIDALERDPATRSIVLISKPPAREVAARVLERAAASAKPFVVCFLGLRDAPSVKNVRFAGTLLQAAELAAQRSLAEEALPRKKAMKGHVRGLFCGGTLCAEAQVVFLQQGEAVASNAPVPGAAQDGRGHLFLDLGDDDYTRGRPHPMLEPELRNEHVARALADPAVGALLIDLVLGYGAHPDPAGVLAGALRPGGKPVIASVTGTEQDPQGWSRQVSRLRAAGVIVASSNAQASAYAAKLASQCSPS
jgi:FdrA protein